MRRRSVLAAVAALAAGGGCLEVVGEDPVEVRARRASDAAENATPCPLSAPFVESHPELERVLSSATTAPDGEWVVTDVDRETGESLAAALRQRCGEVDGVYRYDDSVYRVRVRTADGEPTSPSGSPSSEAIRRGRPQERT